MSSIALIFILGFNVMAREDHEYAPIEEKSVQYKNWTLKNLKADAPAVNLREWAKGKKLVLVVYYAPWCGNWKLEHPVVGRLHEKYKDRGFDVIAVHEYAGVEESRAFFGPSGAPYPVVIESEDRAQRDKTAHFACRMATGDGRHYGSPYNVFLDPSKLAAEGDLLTQKTWVCNGELVEEEADRFIAERLGTEKTETKTEPEKEKSVSR